MSKKISEMSILLGIKAPILINILGQEIKLFVPVLPMLTAPSRNEVLSVAHIEKTPSVGMSLFSVGLIGPQ